MKRRYISSLVAVAMTVCMLLPTTAYAIEPEEKSENNIITEQTSEDQNADDIEKTPEKEEIIPSKLDESSDAKQKNEGNTDGDVQEEKSSDKVEGTEFSVVSDYNSFLSSLKILEGYANDYAIANNEDAVELVINYIRTGIEKYNTDSWAILAGAENTGFTSYVTAQDSENGTNAQWLRGIGNFVLPNGQTAEFAHMFGALNIAYYNDNAAENADFGSWAGDLVDLIEYAKGKVSGTDVESMAQDIRENYLGVDDPESHSFGYQDIYGDLDAFYIMSELTAESRQLSEIFESYFTSSLTDVERAVFFITNRFAGATTQETVREALYESYMENSGARLLETERGLSEESDLRTACCYAFADYLYELAKDKLNTGEESNPYYTVFSSEDSILAPGIEQNIKYALTADEKQIVYYTATVDISRDDVSIYANYKDNDGSSWGMQRVTDQIAAAKAKYSDPSSDRYIENFTPVVGVNADFYNMTNGRPSGALVMEGVEYNGVGSENFFAILKDGTAMIGSPSDYAVYKDQIKEAVGGANYLVKDGKIAVATTDDYYTSRASRTCVGITADGKVVLMVLDGRQEPFSTGGSAEEIAQIMLDAGCVTAINLDGGGSTTYAAKQEGENEISVVNRPSDGYERSVSSSLMVVSTAKSSTEFDHALVTTETDYMTSGASMAVSVLGVSESGNAADLPEGAKLTVSDETIATLKDGVLTGVSEGSVTVSLVLDGENLGSKTVQVVQPDGLNFTKDGMNAVYGSAIELPIEATYNGNSVTICPEDIAFELSTADAGTIEGFAFTGNEESGVRNVTVTASLAKDLSVSDAMKIALYKNGEAVFDFDNAMAGDDSFAWNRDVTNSTTSDEVYYHVVDPDQEMNLSYIFALDMTAVPVPEKIEPLLGLVAGGDLENIRAWDLLLQLAERVGTMTTVTVNLKMDPNLEIDYSEMTLVNEYFTLTGKEFDEETNTLTITCNWNKQTAAIPAETANPVCIVSGIKATPKEDAAWDENECLEITNTGDLSYDIYLRSSTLYNLANMSAMQEQYDIYPYVNPDDQSEKGGHFATTYKTFKDSFTLDKSSWQGWREAGDDLYYYKDNQPATGIQYIPGYKDEDHKYYYQFDENGICQGKVTSLFELDGELYYAINGEAVTGWRMVTEDGEDHYYYFDPDTRKAVDGEQTIDGYCYTFTDRILTRGDLIQSSEGWHYKWAGEWVMNSWVEIDGNKYYAGKQPYGYFVTDLHTYIYKYGSTIEKANCLFDENGVWQENYSGLYTEEDGDTYLIKNGYMEGGAGLVYLDGYYYYFRTSTSTAVKDRVYWITDTNGLLPAGQYQFDSDGKMVNPPEAPDPDEPVPEVKNGIVAENGSLYYYVDGLLTGAGLIQIDGSYYYVRTSNGEVVHDRTYWVTATNDLLPASQYEFDSEGKMVNPPETPDPEEPAPEVKNGIVAENGSLYYYVDGVLNGAGLIQIDGDYYYVKTSNGEVVHGRTYWITATNDLLPSAEYVFADDGKMITD